MLLGATVVCQCGTGPGVRADYPLQKGDDVAFVYRDGSAVLALRNESAPRVEATGASQGNPMVKVADDDHVKALLSRWSDLGFFNSSVETAHPRAKASLVLVINGRRHAATRMPLAMSSVDQIEKFNSYARAFRTVYDHTQAYQSASVQAGDLYRENQRLIDNAREARTRGTIRSSR